MAIIKCKMCGGDLNLTEGQSVAECEYCGSRQTVPNQDNEKKLLQFERAERLRRNCEFDKASGLYEAIVSEFRQEAEAYWGLVLCKYGIEYVDDPATGKKIPTCHRSSFDSILEDPDFEQALENADAVARRVYRQEAKTIEEIRQGILSVSASEKPYDIFICYKETDENGERTLDSVLAQDLYDKLTDKGYRVFFARITLEDKLGQEYEPYIFAALNSAKVMLAVGTDYEYFNAVWVKNEWSRFLKLMAKDKDKYLIPCFKGLDAYDMPREFAKLQAQDLGKMGAIQDLLRNMEKYIPLAKPAVQPLVKEQVMVGTTAGNKIASLLDRGNMALEDGDWDKADSFFEDVLNNDSKNAQAYLGKTLAAEECRTLDALIRNTQEDLEEAFPEERKLELDNQYVEEAAARWSLTGYVSAQTIRNLYRMSAVYSTCVPCRKQQYQEEEAWWAEHKSLARALKFASGEFAEALNAEKKRHFDVLARRVKQAEEDEREAIEEIHRRWEECKRRGDEKAEELYTQACANREKDYEKHLNTAKNTADPITLDACAQIFRDFGTFRDSKALAEHCKTRAMEIREEKSREEIAEKARLAEEEERRVIAQRKAEREAAARRKKIAIPACAAAAALLAVFLVIKLVIMPPVNYNKATELAAQGKYAQAALAYGAAGNYQDAREKSLSLWNEVAQRDTIAAGWDLTVGLKGDSTVVAAGDNDYGQRDTKGWANIVAIAAGNSHSVGLKADGTVRAVGADYYNQCKVRDWTDIVAIAAGGGHTVGLKADGTAVAVGATGNGRCRVGGWRNIVAIAAGGSHTVGLKADGTVVAAGSNAEGQCGVRGWQDIVAISAGAYHTVGLKADGTVVAVGSNNHGQCDVSGWRDIVAIAAGYEHTVGLKADGTVVATGKSYQVTGWQNIVAISAGYDHTVGLKANGTVVAVGDNYSGLTGWKNIKLP